MAESDSSKMDFLPSKSSEPVGNDEDNEDEEIGDDDEDDVIAEVDVFVSGDQNDSLYFLQYPMRPFDQSIDVGLEQRSEIECQFKPKQEKLQMKLPLDASSCSFDRGRSEQIAVNCGASAAVASGSSATASKSKAPFERMMDHQYLISSNTSGFHKDCYAVGLLQNGQLHLNPCKNILQMRPSFAYLDAADARANKAANAAGTSGASGQGADTGGGDSSQDDSETEGGPSTSAQLQTVRVKFKEESEWLRKRREASYQYQQKIKDEETWTPLKFVSDKTAPSTIVSHERSLLLGGLTPRSSDGISGDVMMKSIDPTSSIVRSLGLVPNTPVDMDVSSGNEKNGAKFESEGTKLLRLLAPKADEQKVAAPRHSSTVITLSQLRSLPLADQVRTLLTNVKVLRFSQLLSLLPPKADTSVVLKEAQLCAQLVKGCWVVKSDILHPKGSFSPRTGASADLLCRARDYAMYKFTQQNTIAKRDIAHAVKIPSEDIDDILTQLAKFKIQSGWSFMYPPDMEFIQSHPEIYQQQTTKWEARFKEISQHVTTTTTTSSHPNRQRNISSSGGQQGGASNNSPAARRRRTSSTRNSMSSTIGGDHDGGLMSPPPPGRQSRRRSSSGAGNQQQQRSSSSTRVLINNGAAPSEFASSSLSSASPSKSSSKNHHYYDANLGVELKNFLYDAFTNKPVIGMARIVLELKAKVSELPKDHSLAKCVDERMIDECAAQLGVTKFDRGHGEKFDRTVFAYAGGSWPELRQYLIRYLQEKCQGGKKEKATFRFAAFKQSAQATLTSEYALPNDQEMKQLILEYCILKPGGYYALQDT